MAQSLEERERALAERERAVAVEREQLDARIARFSTAQSDFNAASVAVRDQLRDAWAEVEARQKRMAAEWDEAARFQAQQAASLEERAVEIAAREQTETATHAQLQREVAALREEAAALDARARNTRQLVEELEQRRAEIRSEVLAPPPNAEPPPELRVALDRAADRDLEKWAIDLEHREERLKHDRVAVMAILTAVSKDKTELADRRRVLAEQFEQLATARAQWQEAERVTVAEMEQLARTLRRRESELDARQQQLVRADSRRREDAFELWQLRLRLEAWQAKIVAYEMRWHTEREEIEEDFARRERELAERFSLLAKKTASEYDDAIPFAMPAPDYETPAMPAEVAALRDELERMAAVMLEAELPEPPDPPQSELPWGSEDAPPTPVEDIPDAEPDDAEVILFEPTTRAA